jgi:hypothetical protein
MKPASFLPLTTKERTKMALARPQKPAAGPAAEQPKFEENETQAQTATVEQPKVSDDAAAKAGVSASTAVAKIAAGSLAHAIKTENVLAKMRDAIPAVEFGTFPRLIGANGAVCVKTDNSRNLGETVDVQLLSWSETFVVSPGSDKEEAKDFVRYSRDGVTIDETGEDVNQYLKYLRETEGYKDASKKKYIELIGFLTASQKSGGPTGEIVQVSLSPQSLLTFQAYMANVAVRVRLGQITAEGVENIRVTAEGKSGNGRNWTILKVGAQPK